MNTKRKIELLEMAKKSLSYPYSVYICTAVFRGDGVSDAESEQYISMIHSYKSIAKSQFAGDYWIEGTAWWSCTSAFEDRKIDELLNLKRAFIQYIIDDLKK